MVSGQHLTTLIREENTLSQS